MSNARQGSLVRLWPLVLTAAMGGAAGSALRVATAWGMHALDLPEWMAMTVVNVVGGFLAGWLVARVALPDSSDPLHGSATRRRLVEHGLVAGVLGGFTTVSGYAWIVAWQQNLESPSWQPVTVVALNGVVAITAAGIGVWLGERSRGGGGAGLTSLKCKKS